MHILISNDDGIAAAGIHALAIALHADGHAVTVCAPDRERSASGHALTLHDPLHAKRVSGFDGMDAWAVSGTPVDCVRLGLKALTTRPVDLVVSGINHGPNLGSDTLYSGTVAAAMEALLLDCPALAVSLGTKDAPECFPTAAAWACRVVRWLVQRGLDNQSVYNLNVPALGDEAIKGVRIATLARRRYTNGYERMPNHGDHDAYRLKSWPEGEAVQPGSDITLLAEGYATLTPLSWSMLHASVLSGLMPLEGGL